MTPDDLLAAFSLGTIAALPLGFAMGYYLRPKCKPTEITMLATGAVRVDTGFVERKRDEGATDAH